MNLFFWLALFFFVLLSAHAALLERQRRKLRKYKFDNPLAKIATFEEAEKSFKDGERIWEKERFWNDRDENSGAFLRVCFGASLIIGSGIAWFT